MKIQDVITKPVVAQRNSLLINYYETYYITMKTTIMKFTILIRLYNVFTEFTIMKFTIQKIIITKSIITFENLLKTETCKNQIENK